MKRHKIYAVCLAVSLLCGSGSLVANPLDRGMIVQQTNTIQGTVTDESGELLIGVNVSVKGTTTGTITNIDGEFSLAASSNSTLVISYVGYLTQEIPVGNRNSFMIVLKEDAQNLEEVVVVGYGTTRKKDITGSVASVKASDLNTVSASSVDQMLQGKVAGMNLTQRTAQPGAGVSVNIRGAISPSGNNTPLYVVDGVPIINNSSSEPTYITSAFEYRQGIDRDPLSSINPSDIESIEVLKDASAAAIYGASAANGVVLITTKTGKIGKPRVEFRSVTTAQIPKDYYEVLDAKGFREQANVWSYEKWLFDNKVAPYGNTDPSTLSNQYVPTFSSNEISNIPYNTDWIDEVTRGGYIIDENITVNGGNENTKYFFSYNFYNNVGLLKNSDFKRHSGRLNLDQTFSKYVKAGIKLSFSNMNSSNASSGSGMPGVETYNMIQSAYAFAPDRPIRNEDGTFSSSYHPLLTNPAAFLEINDKSEVTRLFASPNIEVKIIDGLSIKGVGGFDRQISKRNYYMPRAANFYTLPEGMGQLGSNTVDNYSLESYLNYDKVLSEGMHRISAVVGVGYYQTKADGFSMQGVDFFTDAFGADNIGIASNKDKQAITSHRSERTKLSQFFRANYSFMDRYIITFTGRRDGSSYFAENNKWGFFPGVSAAWRLSEEGFLKDKTAFSDLKLRAGYGTAGNENVLGTNSLSLYQSGYNYLIGSTMHTGLALSQIANPNLKWETDITINLGIDFGLWNQRFTGSIEYFHREAHDLLDYQRLPSNNAVGRVAANIGETQSNGFEMMLKSQNINKDVFQWSTDLNISYFKANWRERNPEVALADYIGEKDELDALYGWETDGIITSEADKPSYMANAYVGSIRYVDQNGDGVLDSKDVVKIGHSTPRWLIGLGNNFSWKGFDFNIYFYGALDYQKTRGRVPVPSNVAAAAPNNTFKNVATDMWNSQTGTGKFPGIASDQYAGQNPSSTNNFYLMNGSYVKLKSMTLGYTLPKQLFTRSKTLKGARFFIDAQNIATFTGYEGFDPELQTDNPYPQALSLSFGFNLDF